MDGGGILTAVVCMLLAFAIFPLLLWHRRSDAAAANHRLPPQPLQEERVVRGGATARRMRRRPAAASSSAASTSHDDPSLNIAARIHGPNVCSCETDQYINHIMNETGVSVVLRGKDSRNLGNCHAEALQQPLHLYLSSVHLKSLEAVKVLAENLLDTIASEFGASRVSSSKVYGAVPPLQQLLAGVHTFGTISNAHSTLGPNVSTGASHSSASTGVTAPIVAPSETLQSDAPTYCGFPPPSNLICPIQLANGGTFYSGYENIYPQATPLQQVALTLKHASSTATQVVPATSTPTSTITKVNSSAQMEAEKRSQKRKFQELPVSKAPTAELQVNKTS